MFTCVPHNVPAWPQKSDNFPSLSWVKVGLFFNPALFRVWVIILSNYVFFNDAIRILTNFMYALISPFLHFSPLSYKVTSHMTIITDAVWVISSHLIDWLIDLKWVQVIWATFWQRICQKASIYSLISSCYWSFYTEDYKQYQCITCHSLADSS